MELGEASRDSTGFAAMEEGVEENVAAPSSLGNGSEGALYLHYQGMPEHARSCPGRILGQSVPCISPFGRTGWGKPPPCDI